MPRQFHLEQYNTTLEFDDDLPVDVIYTHIADNYPDTLKGASPEQLAQIQAYRDSANIKKGGERSQMENINAVATTLESVGVPRGVGESLGMIGDTIQRSLRRGAINLTGNIAGGLGTIAETVGADESNVYRRFAEEQKVEAQKPSVAPTLDTEFRGIKDVLDPERALAGIAEQTPQLMLTGAAAKAGGIIGYGGSRLFGATVAKQGSAALSGIAAGSAATVGLQTIGAGYEQGIAAGLDPATARSRAYQSAAWEGTLEYAFGSKLFVPDVEKTRGILGSFIHGASVEGATEFAQSLGTNAIIDRKLDFEQAAIEGVIGAYTGGIYRGVGSLTEARYQRARPQTPAQFQQLYPDLFEMSQLRGLSEPIQKHIRGEISLVDAAKELGVDTAVAHGRYSLIDVKTPGSETQLPIEDAKTAEIEKLNRGILEIQRTVEAMSDPLVGDLINLGRQPKPGEVDLIEDALGIKGEKTPTAFFSGIYKKYLGKDVPGIQDFQAFSAESKDQAISDLLDIASRMRQRIEQLKQGHLSPKQREILRSNELKRLSPEIHAALQGTESMSQFLKGNLTLQDIYQGVYDVYRTPYNESIFGPEGAFKLREALDKKQADEPIYDISNTLDDYKSRYDSYALPADTRVTIARATNGSQAAKFFATMITQVQLKSAAIQQGYDSLEAFQAEHKLEYEALVDETVAKLNKDAARPPQFQDMSSRQQQRAIRRGVFLPKPIDWMRRFPADQKWNGQQLLAKMQKELSKDDLFWSGLSEEPFQQWLKENPKPTSAEVVGWLEENATQVEVKKFLDPNELIDTLGWTLIVDGTEKSIRQAIDDGDATVSGDKLVMTNGKPMQGIDYAGKFIAEDNTRTLRDNESHQGLALGDTYYEMAITFPKPEGQPNLIGSHLRRKLPNVAAHVRFEVTGDHMIVHELQSDLVEMLKGKYKVGFHQLPPLDEDENVDYIPAAKAQAPFVENWQHLAITQILQYAIENDINYITFPTNDTAVRSLQGWGSIDTAKTRQVTSFYEKLPAVLRKILDRFNPQLETDQGMIFPYPIGYTTDAGVKKSPIYYNPVDRTFSLGSDGESFSALLDLIKFSKREGYMLESKPSESTTLVISDEMRESLFDQGLPVSYKQKASGGDRGAFRFRRTDHAAVISMWIDRADATTAIHETMHFLTHRLKGGFRDALEDMIGKRVDNFTRQDHEIVADSLAAYLIAGNVPEQYAHLAPIFDEAKELMKSIYDVYPGALKKVNLTPQLKQAFDHMFVTGLTPQTKKFEITQGPEKVTADQIIDLMDESGVYEDSGASDDIDGLYKQTSEDKQSLDAAYDEAFGHPKKPMKNKAAHPNWSEYGEIIDLIGNLWEHSPGKQQRIIEKAMELDNKREAAIYIQQALHHGGESLNDVEKLVVMAQYKRIMRTMEARLQAGDPMLTDKIRKLITIVGPAYNEVASSLGASMSAIQRFHSGSLTAQIWLQKNAGNISKEQRRIVEEFVAGNNTGTPPSAEKIAELLQMLDNPKLKAGYLLRTYIHSNILSSPQSRATDVVANKANLLLHPIRDFFEVSADAAFSAVSGSPRTRYFGELNAYRNVPLLVRSTVKGLKEARDIVLYRKAFVDSSTKFDYGVSSRLVVEYGAHDQKLSKRYLYRTLFWPMKWIGAIDIADAAIAEAVFTEQLKYRVAQWQKEGTVKENITRVVERFGRSRGWNRKQIADEVFKATQNPDDARYFIDSEMRRLADRVLFREEPGNVTKSAIKVFDSIDRMINVPQVIPYVGGMNIPLMRSSYVAFISTMVNVMKTSAEITPGVGLLASGWGRTPLEVAGAQLAGGTLALLMMSLYNSGHLTGPEPEDEDAKKFWKEHNIKPYAMRFEFGDQAFYVQFPDQLKLPLIATINGLETWKNAKNGQEAAEGIFKTISAIRTATYESTYFKSVGDLLTGSEKTFGSNENRAASFAYNQLKRTQNLVPYSSFMRWFSQQADAVLNDGIVELKDEWPDPQDDLKTAFTKIYGPVVPGFLQGKIPNAIPTRNDVPTRINVFGEPLTSEEMMAGRVPVDWLGGNLLHKQNKIDAVEQEFINLDFYPSAPNRRRSFAKRMIEMSDDEYSSYVLEYGRLTKERLPRIISNPSYSNLPYERKVKLIGEQLSTYREEAWNKAKATYGRAWVERVRPFPVGAVVLPPPPQ